MLQMGLAGFKYSGPFVNLIAAERVDEGANENDERDHVKGGKFKHQYGRCFQTLNHVSLGMFSSSKTGRDAALVRCLRCSSAVVFWTRSSEEFC